MASGYGLGVLLGESSVILLLATAQTPVALLGSIDVSTAALASLTSVVIATVLPRGGAAGVACAIGLATGLGALQGLVHARARIPSFVVTLAGMGVWSGIALSVAPATVPIGEGYGAIGWLDGRTLGVSRAFLCGLSVLVALRHALTRLPLGRRVHAIGMAEAAALLSGVRVARVKVFAFAASGLCSGMAGLVMAARTGSGNPTIADALLLPSIAAVMVGGTALTGGHGGLGRTLVGALVVTVIRIGVGVTGIAPAWDPIAFGALVVIAAAATVDRAKLRVVK